MIGERKLTMLDNAMYSTNTFVDLEFYNLRTVLVQYGCRVPSTLFRTTARGS